MELELPLPKLAVFKYRHDGRAVLAPRHKLWFWLTLAGALVAGLAFFPFGLFALVVPFVIRATAQRTLVVGPRYLICADRVVHYANVTGLHLSEASGTLRLDLPGERPLLIERERFPTAARKAPKIAANQAAKFAKVSAKIIDKVRRASPEFSGAAAPARG